MEVAYLDEMGWGMQRLLEEHKLEGINLSVYSAAESEKERLSMLWGAHCLLTVTPRVDGELLGNAPEIRLVQKIGPGTDNIDLAAAAS